MKPRHLHGLTRTLRVVAALIMLQSALIPAEGAHATAAPVAMVLGDIKKYDPVQNGPHSFTIEIKDTRADANDNPVNQVVMIGVLALNQAFRPSLTVTTPSGSPADCMGRSQAVTDEKTALVFCQAHGATQGTHTINVLDGATGTTPTLPYAVFMQETYGRPRLSGTISTSLGYQRVGIFEYIRTGTANTLTFSVQALGSNPQPYGFIFDDRGNEICANNSTSCAMNNSNVEKYFVMGFNNSGSATVRFRLS